jgi:TDG/mug DNA glycosylase family protein
LQDECIGATRVFVLPSPSGQARGHWDIGPWRALAAQFTLERAMQAPGQ